MKRIFFLLFGMLLSIKGFTQEPETVSDLMRYYKQNIQELKPIEGVFDVEELRVVNEDYVPYGMPSIIRHHYQRFIFYSREKGKFFVFHPDSNSDKLNDLNYRIVTYDNNSYVVNGRSINNPNNFEIVEYTQIAKEKYTYTKVFPTPEMYAQVAKPKEWSGTGFALNQGYIITNYHVVDGASKISVQGANGNFNTRLNAIIVASDRANDIALLKISDGRFSGFGNIPYQLRTEVAEVGESVFALGYPLASIMGDEIKFTDGRISSRTGVQGAVNVYQISVPIQPGNSGGPLFDQQGRIVGITSSSLNKEVFSSENVNYAIKSGYILNLIDSSVGRGVLPTGVTMRNMDITNKIKAAKKFVFYIQCER